MKQENKTLLDWALYYRKLGWSIFPVDGNKKPLVKSWIGYQKNFATDEEINKWFSHPKEVKGIAVVTGSLSKLIVLDLDVGADISGKTLPPTPTVKTGGGGWHHYFRYPDNQVIGNSASKVGNKIDIRGEGGYVVAPPSLHPSGNTYIWADSLSPKDVDLAEVPEWILNKVHSSFEKKDISKITEGVEKGSRNQSAAILAGKLLAHLPEDEWYETGWAIFKALNQNNNPPLSETELKQIFKSIRDREKEKRTGKKEWTPPVSISDLCKKDFPEQKWVVENIFETSTIGQLSAAPNQWKTWIMWHMAICIANGSKVFGKFETSKQGVMIVNEEDPERMLKERALMLLEQPDDIPIYIHAEKGIKLECAVEGGISDSVTHILREVEEKEISVVIFDSLSVIHSADENSAQEMGAVLEQMKLLTRKGLTVLFTNHHRKRSMKSWEKDDLQEQTRGSTVINAVPSGHITCEEKIQGEDKFVVIRQAKLKGAKKIAPFLVRIKELEGKIYFEYEGEHEESLGAATKLKNELYTIIQESGSWLGIKDLKDMLGKSEKPIRDQIKVLEKEKQIETKTRSELIRLGIPVPERERSSGQEFLYFKVDGVKEEDDLTTLVHP